MLPLPLPHPRRLLILLLPLAVAACGGGGGGSGGGSSGGDVVSGECGTPPDGGSLQNAAWQILDDARRRGDIDGYSLEIGTADARLACLSAGDIASRNTPVLIASGGKPISASVILSLVDETASRPDLDPGRLQLDEPIARYLGDTPAGNTEAAQTVTLRQLLNHTSGLSATECIDGSNNTDFTLLDCATQVLEAGIGNQGEFSYGGGSYQVAGAVAEVFSKQDWQTLVNERIAAPLNADFPFFPRANPRVAGGVLTTAADLGAFQQAVLTRDPALLTTADHEQFRSPEANTRGAMLPGVTATGYSFGFWIEDADTLAQAGSAGPELSSPGFFGAVPWIDDDRGYYGVLLLRESDYRTGLALMRQLRAEILNRLP